MNFCFNYNKSVLDDKLLNKKYRINKYYSTNINSIEFVNKHSVSDDKLFFTNKLQRGNGHRIDMLRNSISDLINNPHNLDKYFDGREISMSTKADVKKLNRLNGILNLYEKVPNGELIFKYAPNKKFFLKYLTKNRDYERGFQLFYTRDKYNNVKVYLIDLYHLVIPSKSNNSKEEYINRVNFKKDIYDYVFNKIIINKEDTTKVNS